MNSDYIKIAVKTFYLEMDKKPEGKSYDLPDNCRIDEIDNLSCANYREIFASVGSEWGWASRLILNDSELSNIINSENTKIYFLYFKNEFAGFAELNMQDKNNIELIFFGLLPSFIGKGLGGYFLSYIIEKGWSFNPDKLWLHTCEFDHPQAIKVYQRSGFVLCKEEIGNSYYNKEFLKKKSFKYE